MKRRSRNGRARLWWMLGVGLTIGWMIWFIQAERLVLEGPEGIRILPFEVHDHVALAYSWDPVRPGSLRLICTSTGELRLVLQTLLPDRRYRGNVPGLTPQARAAQLNIPGNVRAVLFVDVGTGHGLSFAHARFVAIEPVDTIVTEQLSAHQLGSLADWLDQGWRKHFGFHALEQGVSLNGFTHGDEIRSLVARCLRRS